MNKSFLLIVLIIINFNLVAQENHLKNNEEIRVFSEKIVRSLSQNEITESFKELAQYWPIPQNEIDNLEENTIKYFNLFKQRFGNSMGFIKTNNEVIADFAIRETYLIRYEFTAVRVLITYYRNSYGWIVNSFMWDDSISEEFR